MSLDLDKIVLDPSMQAREEIDHDHVGELTEVLGAKGGKGKFKDPLDVFFDGGLYRLANGYHRHAAYLAANRKKADVLIHEGGLREAILFSIGANADHGKRRTNADKRRAVARLLEDQEWRGNTDRWVADAANVSNHLVQVMRSELGQSSVSEQSASVGKSPNSISKSPDKTDSSVGAPASEHSPGPAPEKRAGRDGKQYPATKPVAQKKPSKYEVLQALKDRTSFRRHQNYENMDPATQMLMVAHRIDGQAEPDAERMARAGVPAASAVPDPPSSPAPANGRADPEPDAVQPAADWQEPDWLPAFCDVLREQLAVLKKHEGDPRVFVESVRQALETALGGCGA